jgi:6-phosphogluconolactonase
VVARGAQVTRDFGEKHAACALFANVSFRSFALSCFRDRLLNHESATVRNREKHIHSILRRFFFVERHASMMKYTRIAQVVFCVLLSQLAIGTEWSRGQGGPESASDEISKGDTLVYVGTYTGENSDSKGIYLFRLAMTEREVARSQPLVPLGLAAEVASPSFLEIDAERRLLFAVNETSDFGGRPTGAVTSYSIDSATGKLKQLSQQPSMGAGPCHLVLDRQHRHVLVANYGSGSVAVLPIGNDGALGEATDVEQHAGKSVNPHRQEGPHAHCVTFDPAGHFLFVCDLGLDKVMIYRYDAEQGKLTANEPAFASVKPGAGPRHVAFRPDGRFAYVINELNSTVTAFADDAEAGSLRELQTVSTLPPSFNGSNTTAEIAVHPSGKYVYGSNRGHDSVALFEIDEAAGTLAFVEAYSTGGKTPRNFELDRKGDHLIIANQNTNTLLVCGVDGKSGRLRPSGALVEAPTPVCVKFLELIE